MKDYEIQIVIDALKTNLASSDKQWDDKVSHAEIVGYLQGTIKGVINALESKIKQSK
jgi:hypothetical protein